MAYASNYPSLDIIDWRQSSVQSQYFNQWRAEDVEQRNLENARRIWERHVAENRQAVEEHAEYMRSMATLSAFIAGFVNIAFVQFAFDPSQLPYAVMMGFGITNTLTMALTTCCMAICTLVLASIFRTFTALLSEEEEAIFLMRCRDFVLGYQVGNKPPAPLRNFRNHWDFFCRAEWRRALFMFSAGIFCFLINTAFAAFIKFSRYYTAAIVLAASLGPGVLTCFFFHARWMPHILDTSITRPMDVDAHKEAMGMPFDWHLPGIKAQKSTAAPAFSTDSTNSTPLTTSSPTDLSILPPWRADIVEQRNLRNARYLWQRFVSKTRSEVEERTEQLRSFSFLSGVLAGFAVASLLQLQFDVTTTKSSLQLWFAVSNALSAACSTSSMAMCSLMLMSVIKTGRALISEEEESRFLRDCLAFVSLYKPGSKPPAPKRTFRTHWDTRCEDEWNRAFYLFSLGLAMFVVNMLAGAWIKYHPFRSVSIVSNVIMGLALLYLFYTHSRWAPYLVGSTTSDQGRKLAIKHVTLSPAGLPFDWHQPPVSYPAAPTAASRRLPQSRDIPSDALQSKSESLADSVSEGPGNS